MPVVRRSAPSALPLPSISRATRTFTRVATTITALALSACATSGTSSMPSSSSSSSSSSSASSAMPANCRPLTLASWRGYRTQALPANWSEANGVITKTGEAEDLVSRDMYGNFDLRLDWKLAPGGNAGVFYRGTEEYDHIYWSAPEYQLLDDARHPDGKNRLTSAASAYGLYAPPAGVVHEAGEWNSTRIVARGNHIEHWLNGQKVVEYDLMSPDWEAKVKASKFGEWPHYGRAARGYIGIQGDHNGELTLRNVCIEALP